MLPHFCIYKTGVWGKVRELERAGENQIPRVAMENGNMAFVAVALPLEIVSAHI